MTTASTLTLAQVNALSQLDFVTAFGDVAEHAPWVATRAAEARPFDSLDSMIEAFVAAIREASAPWQLDLLRAHPDLAGKAAVAGELTDASTREQAGAGLDRLTQSEYERFTRLNAAYVGRFGFPFIFAVRGATKDQILAGFEARIDGTQDEEFATALDQVARIVRFRLEDRIEQT